MKNKKKVVNLLRLGILLFGIPILLWNCENENIIDYQEVTTQNKFQKIFNKKDFKQTIPFSYKVNWANSIKKYSEELKTDFYEFELTYDTPFNPTAINKSKKEGYNTAYKLIATESSEDKVEFFIAKFFQKKDGQVQIENLSISLNNNSGYKGLTHLYDNSNELYFAKKINTKENKEAKRYFKNEQLKIKNPNLAAKDVTVCNTTTLYNYIDWYRYTYDAYGKLISVVYLYTEYVGSSSTTTCTTEFQPDEPVRIIRNPNHVPCNDGTGRTNCVKYIEPQILCEVGFEPDKNGGCKEVSNFDENDINNIKFFLVSQLNLSAAQKEWLNNFKNIQSKKAIDDYLNLYALTPEYKNVKDFAYKMINHWMLNGNLIFTNHSIKYINENFELTKKSPFNVDMTQVLDSISLPANDPSKAANQKFLCLYNKLTTSSSYKNLFTNIFGGNQDLLNTQFKITKNLKNSRGERKNGLRTVLPGSTRVNGVITKLNILIEIDQDLLDLNSNYNAIKTIIHESIHAFLTLKKLTCNNQTALDSYNNDDISETINTLYNSFCTTNLNQHDFMFNNMVPIFKTIFEEIGKPNFTSQGSITGLSTYDLQTLNYNANLGVNFVSPHLFNWDEFYLYNSLPGLHNTTSFQNEIQNDIIKNQLYKAYKFVGKQSLSKGCN
ncbi:hypothetical protein [Tenacibaculum finnmarkense]|uniref:hypothetical protein n=1 Tax=Tenacibaculum finnmarkense TaxID=2781243 RepID=UPI003BB750E1